jgi:hypothetical protein
MRLETPAYDCRFWEFVKTEPSRLRETVVEFGESEERDLQGRKKNDVGGKTLNQTLVKSRYQIEPVTPSGSLLIVLP